MTILYAATQGVAALKSEALAKHIAKSQRVLRCGNQWLHWSGLKLTDDRNHAWVGSLDQARACRAKFPAAADCKAVSVNATIPKPIPQQETVQ